MRDWGISPVGVLGILMGGLIAVVMPKGEPCTCTEQVDPEWVASLQRQRETDYEAFLDMKGSLPFCAAQWLQLNEYDTKTNPIIDH